MIIIHKSILIKENIKPNRHMWIGDGFFFCRVCDFYRYHSAYSPVDSNLMKDCYEVCNTCNCYSTYSHAVLFQ